jgi:hypothetical protein
MMSLDEPCDMLVVPCHGDLENGLVICASLGVWGEGWYQAASGGVGGRMGWPLFSDPRAD